MRSIVALRKTFGIHAIIPKQCLFVPRWQLVKGAAKAGTMQRSEIAPIKPPPGGRKFLHILVMNAGTVLKDALSAVGCHTICSGAARKSIRIARIKGWKASSINSGFFDFFVLRFALHNTQAQ